jgi:hypothetical protein
MKLFNQLNEIEQEEIVDHCVDLILDDMTDEETSFKPVIDEESQNHDESSHERKLIRALEHIKTLSTKEEKTEYLMSDECVADTIYGMAFSMASQAYCHDNDDLVIFYDSIDPDTIEHEEDCPNNPENLKKEDAKLLSDGRKKVSSLN